MLVNILYDFLEGPWGGGNQFLKALKDNFKSKNIYEENPLKSDIILVNSKDNLDKARDLVVNYNKKCVHRLDGIFKLYRGDSDYDNDLRVYYFMKKYASGVVYQSKWSQEQHKINGAKSLSNEKVIYNAVNPFIFSKGENIINNKVKLITTSWSSNIRKGFHFLKYLDEYLDFNKFEYTFIGNSPISFKNIKMINPLDSKGISKNLKQHNIFITGTENDTCSNSLIEALSCGLPVIALNSGGSPELIGNGGKTFNNNEELMECINKVSNDLSYYKSNINTFDINYIGDQYYNFLKNV